ncbi:protease modulator HflC [Biformimicrobium ophioploci]|uniref:Protein HflC n=1 Tax=Biformimicrobium ophioploci TaxID=3036711 RepID=A0ABQ6LUW1_9GAMM|nr:protease modulator HflC [Microbulbifer sp. NKW57]GMG85878.1 protease modulator HflC [Microbulbifer sp. NKW57]
MNSNKLMIPLLVVLLALLVIGNSAFIVDEKERAVMLQFGRVVKDDIKPGLHFKVPLMHEIRKFDARILTMDSRPQRYLTIEKKAMMVDSYAKWRILDVPTYYTSTGGDPAVAERLLAQRVNEGLRNQFGRRTLHEVVSGERDELMVELTESLNKVVKPKLGIEVIDVRVKRIDLPEEVSESVYARMTTEREREARDHRAKGNERATIIRAEADRQKVVIESEGYRKSEELRGQGDAQAANIYAEAYNKDAEFYRFTRSLTAYRNTFSNKGDVMLIDPESQFFRYLKDAEGKAD